MIRQILTQKTKTRPKRILHVRLSLSQYVYVVDSVKRCQQAVRNKFSVKIEVQDTFTILILVIIEDKNGNCVTFLA